MCILSASPPAFVWLPVRDLVRAGAGELRWLVMIAAAWLHWLVQYSGTFSRLELVAVAPIILGSRLIFSRLPCVYIP